MSIVMNMAGYEIEREPLANEDYSDEVLCAEWNPQLRLASEIPAAKKDNPASLPCALAEMDVDAFLQKMYLDQ
jgi:hypothetical protein